MNEQVAAPRIGGWLLLPLAWLIMTLLTTVLVLAMYLTPLFNPEWRVALFSHGSTLLSYWAISLLTAVAVWAYSLWIS